MTRKLNADGVPPIGVRPHWVCSYVTKILASRSPVGEFQPTKWSGNKPSPDGPPIPGYFPAVLSDQQWHAARSAMDKRHRPGRGARLGTTNLFLGRLTDGVSGGPIHIAGKKSIRYLCPYYSRLGIPGPSGVAGRAALFPYLVFEAAVLSVLKELDPAAVLPTDRTRDKTLALTGRRDRIEGRIAKLQAALVGDGEVGPVVTAIRTLQAELDAVAAELAAERRRAASPLAQAWGDYRSLADAIRVRPRP